MLSEPLLYTSLYFKTHRQTYYELLERVRTEGDWEGWLKFFYEGVLEAATQAVRASRSILSLVEKDRQRIEALGRPAITALRLHQLLQKKPIISAPKGAIELGLTRPTVAQALEHLQRLKIVREFTGRERNRLFVYDKYVKILSEGTEPIRTV
jgi:Fic family protein